MNFIWEIWDAIHQLISPHHRRQVRELQSILDRRLKEITETRDD